MSFRLFIYYCAVCGAWAALLGWGVGQLLVFAAKVDPTTQRFAYNLLVGTASGTVLALGLAVVDALWSAGRRASSQIMIRAVVVAGLGLVASLVGTALGALLARFIPLLLLVGWIVMGVLIGVTLGLYDLLARMKNREGASGATRKLTNGFIGGSLGGLLGGILYLGASILLGLALKRDPLDLFSASAWGFAALGASIGLMIGLAQVILKEAWIKVEAGFRPGRELIISKDEITIGRGEGCDIGLFGDAGVEKLHARIIQKKNRYLVADAGTPGGTFVNDQRVTQPQPLRSGDAIRIGNSVLRFGERQKRKT
jgi:hypothetical protein